MHLPPDDCRTAFIVQHVTCQASPFPILYPPQPNFANRCTATEGPELCAKRPRQVGGDTYPAVVCIERGAVYGTERGTACKHGLLPRLFNFRSPRTPPPAPRQTYVGFCWRRGTKRLLANDGIVCLRRRAPQPFCPWNINHCASNNF